MAFLVLKANYLRFNGRAIAGTRRQNRAVVKGGAVKIVHNNCVGLQIRIGQIAGELIFGRSVVHKRKRINIFVPILNFAFRIIDGSAIHARGRTRLKTADLKADIDKILR